MQFYKPHKPLIPWLIETKRSWEQVLLRIFCTLMLNMETLYSHITANTEFRKQSGVLKDVKFL